MRHGQLPHDPGRSPWLDNVIHGRLAAESRAVGQCKKYISLHKSMRNGVVAKMTVSCKFCMIREIQGPCPVRS